MQWICIWNAARVYLCTVCLKKINCDNQAMHHTIPVCLQSTKSHNNIMHILFHAGLWFHLLHPASRHQCQALSSWGNDSPGWTRGQSSIWRRVEGESAGTLRRSKVRGINWAHLHVTLSSHDINLVLTQQVSNFSRRISCPRCAEGADLMNAQSTCN